MRDAAYAENIGKDWTGIVGGYLKRGDPFHPWTPQHWAQFKGNKKLPIFINKHLGKPEDAEADAFAVLRELYNLGVPGGTNVVLDVETQVDVPYVRRFGAVMRRFGHRVFVYGSSSTLFQNPPLDGYWVAAPREGQQPYMYDHAGVVATQYALDVKPGIDRSTVRWRVQQGKWWK